MHTRLNGIMIFLIIVCPYLCKAEEQNDETNKNDPQHNIKMWALGCAGVLNERNHGRHDSLNPGDINEKNIKSWKRTLDQWDVKTRSDLLENLNWITTGGHRKDFAIRGIYVQRLSEDQFNALKKKQSDFPEEQNRMLIAKTYYPSLGKKGLLGWDYSRYICLCRWGYSVGLISEEEAWERIIPVARMLQKAFDSWEDLGRNYLIGRNFWSYQKTQENGQLYVDAFQRLLDMQSSPWNQYSWNMDLKDAPTSNDPNNQTDQVLAVANEPDRSEE